MTIIDLDLFLNEAIHRVPGSLAGYRGKGYTIKRNGRIDPANIGHGYVFNNEGWCLGEVFLNGSGPEAKYVFKCHGSTTDY